MPKEDFQIKGSLGKGSFGSVVKCIRVSDGEVYAMKQIKIQKLKEKDKLNALNQIRFLASIQHPHIISYKQAFYDELTETLCVVMEFADEGDLDGKVKKNLKQGTRFTEKDLWKVAYQSLQGLTKLHDSNIIHRDIKAANIFFHQGNVKIGDLNVAKHLKDSFTSTQTGTPYYASPEVWSEQPYNYKSDVWSLGCVLYEMAMLKPPFRAENAQALFKKIMSGKFEKISSIYSKALNDFIGKCLIVDQKLRPTAKDLLGLSVMLELKQNIYPPLEDSEDPLMQTINVPTNFKVLNQNLPKPNYQNKPKTLKNIQFASQLNSNKKLPSMKNIPRSQKHIDLQNKLLVPQKPKVLNKMASQKLIF